MAIKRIKVLRNATVPEKEIAREEAPDVGALRTENPVGSTHAPRFDSILRDTLYPRHQVPAGPTREVVIEYDLRDMTYMVRIPDIRMLIPGEVIDSLRYSRPLAEAREVLVGYIMDRVHDFVASAVHRMDRL